MASARRSSAATGDLDIKKDVIIDGGSGGVIIATNPNFSDPNFYNDRLFHVLSYAKATFKNLTIKGGRETQGGGIYVAYAAQLVLSGSTISDNTASNLAGNIYGGGIFSRGTLTVTESTFANNTASAPSASSATTIAHGGGLAPIGGTTTVTNSTFYGNKALGYSGSGGGIDNYSATLNLTNVTVSGNTADYGGGGIENANPNSSLKLINVTINSNSAPKTGANIYNYSGYFSSKNTIVANPQGGGANCEEAFHPLSTLGHNLEYPGTSCGFTGPGDIQNQNPHLLPLADRGGPTKTHALAVDLTDPADPIFISPAIDRADNTSCPSTDQRGMARPYDAEDDGWASCDIGSFEYSPPPNDKFADAQAISASSVSIKGFTAGATRELNEPDHYSSNPDDPDFPDGDHSVWYRWTSPAPWTALASDSVTIDTCTANIDSILAVYKGSSLNSLTRVADDNNGCSTGWGSKLAFKPTPGTTYYIAVADTGGLRESSFTLKFDRPPVVIAPKQSLLSNSAINTSGTVPVKLAWSATDADGIASYDPQQSTNGGAWTALTLPSATTATITPSLSPGSTYRFRVRAKDNAGNWSTWSYGPLFKVNPYQEASSTVAYTGTWLTSGYYPTSFYGGYVKYASAYGAKAKFAFTGSNVAWVATKGPSRGKAYVYVDGVYASTVDLYSSSNLFRQVVFSKSWDSSGPHTIEVRVIGQKNPAATGTFVDVDAFLTTN